jgi:alanine-glyoxylate transaminase/serine-glyoxylate transaminase/serine-pyruvate transaminase
MTTAPLLSQYPDLDTPARILLGPGPSMVHPRVTRAMSSLVVGHLDPYFLIVMDHSRLPPRFPG